MHHYKYLLPALRRAGVVFQPMVWSAEGRSHPAAVRIMACTQKLIKTKLGAEEVAGFGERWRHESAIAIQRRKAAMIRAVLPTMSRRQRWMLNGHDSGPRLPSIEEDEDAENDSQNDG